MGDGIAVGCTFDAASKSFDFTVSDGTRKVLSFPDASAAEIARLIEDLQSCMPVIEQGEPRDDPN